MCFERCGYIRWGTHTRLREVLAKTLNSHKNMLRVLSENNLYMKDFRIMGSYYNNFVPPFMFCNCCYCNILKIKLTKTLPHWLFLLKMIQIKQCFSICLVQAQRFNSLLKTFRCSAQMKQHALWDCGLQFKRERFLLKQDFTTSRHLGRFQTGHVSCGPTQVRLFLEHPVALVWFHTQLDSL